ncbi:30S ribosomal protein S14 [Sneathia sanguinegens]|uniref:Small ribosomal subunit protein uS14 n=1 Tax=Sneathia sanguinegens TaxID=40543 RepID=A0ABT7HKW7_9FUSO|nr:30S ribosomal protein S14 [Sneathia sanguinegens]MDK9581151.1 30S ribosomal protein S14 [Sneathia sanguinegens]MDU4652862.1 30S ribosomal protein S14 [Sneathia sanguinegens]MDU7497405.1 30S ribosomal protein S14 [Sneathia sanguinegens]
MAKVAMVQKNLRRAKTVDKYAKKRAELKERIKKGDREAILELQKLPRNASPTRLRNRCKINGRPRGYMREFGISRVMFRKLAGEASIPGITKSSW